MKKKNKSKILIGKGWIHGRLCRLFGRTDWTAGKGELFFPSNDNVFIDIHVALDCDWPATVDALTHEAVEACMIIKGLGYQKIFQEHYDTTTRCFHLTHEEFTEVITMATSFTTGMLTSDRPLEKAWCKANKRKVIK